MSTNTLSLPFTCDRQAPIYIPLGPILNVSEYLDLKEILLCCQVSKQWLTVFGSDELLSWRFPTWAALIRRHASDTKIRD